MGEFQLRLQRKFVPDAELLADLRRVAALLGREAVTREAYTDRGQFNGATLANRFGAWPKALQAAGLKPTGYRHIRDEELFENLAAVWRALGRQPVIEDMHPAAGRSRYSPGTYQKRFGSWNRALLRFIAYQEGSDWRSGAKGNAWERRPQPPAPSPEEKGGTATATARAARASPPALRGPTSPRQLQPWRDELPSLGVGLGDAMAVEQLPSREFPSAIAAVAMEKEGPAEVGGKMRRRIPGWRLRARVLQRDRSTCQLCGASPATDPRTVLHVDHIIPWSKGGETVEDNLRTLCEACNVGRGNSELPATD